MLELLRMLARAAMHAPDLTTAERLAYLSDLSDAYMVAGELS